jgi:hypothetical protein
LKISKQFSPFLGIPFFLASFALENKEPSTKDTNLLFSWRLTNGDNQDVFYTGISRF